MNDIVHRIYHIGLSRTEVAALAPMVISAARNGDQAVCQIIELGVQELVMAVHVVATKLNLLMRPEIVLVGGLQNATDVFVEPLRQALSDSLPDSMLRTPELSPVMGACVLALQHSMSTLMWWHPDYAIVNHYQKGNGPSAMIARSIDFRDGPKNSQSCIGRPDDLYKSLVNEQGRLLYDFERDWSRPGSFRFNPIVAGTDYVAPMLGALKRRSLIRIKQRFDSHC